MLTDWKKKNWIMLFPVDKPQASWYNKIEGKKIKRKQSREIPIKKNVYLIK